MKNTKTKIIPIIVMLTLITSCFAAMPKISAAEPTQPHNEYCTTQEGYEEITETIEATCTEKGYIKVSCSICKNEIDYIEIPALGHDEGVWGEENWEDWDYDHGRYNDEYLPDPRTTCKRCGEIFYLFTYTPWPEMDTEPNCFIGGQEGWKYEYKGYTAVRYVPNGIGPLEHEPDDWVITREEPTCTKDGVERHVCQINNFHTITTVIAALGHDFVFIERDGDYLHFCCSVCGEEDNRYEPETTTIVSITPTASVKQLNGNKNDLTITITEQFSDGTTNVISKTFSINNNTADTYTIDSYNVYVDTKGNTQIRACYITT